MNQQNFYIVVIAFSFSPGACKLIDIIETCIVVEQTVLKVLCSIQDCNVILYFFYTVGIVSISNKIIGENITF